VPFGAFLYLPPFELQNPLNCFFIHSRQQGDPPVAIGRKLLHLLFDLADPFFIELSFPRSGTVVQCPSGNTEPSAQLTDGDVMPLLFHFALHLHHFVSSPNRASYFFKAIFSRVNSPMTAFISLIFSSYIAAISLGRARS